MKILCSLIAASALLSGTPAKVEGAPCGTYVEARSASVYAGACHYNSEYCTAGREAVLAWRFEGGSFGGQSLAGQTLVVALAAEDNLDKTGVERTAVAYLPESASAAQREALLDWLQSEHAGLLGELRATRSVPIAFESKCGAFEVRAGASVELSGSELPDRECCKMPYNVWYAPFERVQDPIVGCVERFACLEPALDCNFSRRGENSAFAGRFGLIARVCE